MLSWEIIANIPRGTRILLPESSDIRVLMAARELQIAGIIEPVLLWDHGNIERVFRSSREFSEESLAVLQNIETLPLDTSHGEELARVYSEKKWIPESDALKLFPSDLAHAAALLSSGWVAWVVAGSIATTADVIRTGYYGLGLAPGRRISWEFLMYPGEESISHESYTIGDSAVTPDPSASELVAIAESLVETHTRFHTTLPRVAFLSYSTYESGSWASVEKMQAATNIFREKHTDIESDGPLQFDAATRWDIYEAKTKWQWKLTWVANILVFPDLDSGNIAYKMMESMGGYKAIWPILTGFRTPGWSDLSRGTTVETIIDMAYVTAVRSLES